MSGPDESGGHEENSGSVLANLPRTRPQRATARRAATRGTRAPAAAGAANGNGARPPAAKPEPAGRPARAKTGAPKARAGAKTPRGAGAKASPTARTRANGARGAAAANSSRAPAAKRRTSAKRAVRAAAEEVPRQGFECEHERATGAVPPPGTADFLSTAVEALGELAKAGISGGERVLHDVLSRLGR